MEYATDRTKGQVMEAATAETYNGWKNYPTWVVNLWLSNDEGLYHATLERIANLQGASSEKPATWLVADDLKDWVQDELAPDLGATFAADLLGYALGEVDWFEIAEAWMED